MKLFKFKHFGVSTLSNSVAFFIACLCFIQPVQAGLLTADLSISVDDGVTAATAGGQLTYTITASNAGPDDIPSVTVQDTFPINLTCSTTCIASAGSSCTAGPVAGNLNDTAVSLLANGTATYTAVCDIASSAPAGAITNTATIASGATDPNTANNTDSDTDTIIGLSADLSVTVSDSVDPVDAGNPLTYTIQVDNAGPSDATVVVATNTLSADVTLNSTTGCTEDPTGVPTCSLGTITAGNSAMYTVLVDVNAGITGSISSMFSVASAATDPDTNNNMETETTAIVDVSDLSITVDDGVTAAIAGNQVTYTIVATNLGPADVTGATVQDTFPASLTCSTTCLASAGSSCSAGPVAGNLNDAAVDLLFNGTATYTAVCDIASDASGTLNNTATVSSAANDTNMANNTATDMDTVLGASADLSITKTDSADPVGAGDNLTYTIQVDNAGPSDAAGVVVTDTLPAGVTFVSTSGCAEDPTGVPTCTLGTVTAGSSASYTVAVTVDNGTFGNITNNASVTSSTTDPDLNNNDTDEMTGVNGISDLSVSVDDGLTAATAGEQLTYTIVATNLGPAPVTGATVQDMFPASLSCSTTCVASAGSSCTAGPVAGDLNDTAVDLLANGTATYTAVCDIASDATGTLTNTANVSSTANDPDNNNNSATDNNTVIGTSADLSITKTDRADPVSPGNNLTYTIQVDNAGPSDAADVVVTDTLPAGVTFVSTTGCTEDPNGVPTCSLGTVAAGGSSSFTVVVSIDAATSGAIDNTASVASSTTDPDTNNNSAVEQTTVNALESDLSLSLSADTNQVASGGQIIYTLVASNAGPADVTGATVVDNFPAALSCSTTCVASAGSSCTAGPIAGDINDTVVDLLANGTATYTSVCTVSQTAAPGTLNNTATISSGNSDPVTANNNANNQAQILGPLLPPTNVPTMSFYGMLLLALCILIMMMRQRHLINAAVQRSKR
ncbi:hypothetical protein [Marinicella sp. W31]|uniref:hypothetical protein n=1 Tax=Marinicella sp. W31 TaxID=3023713 RepID=UPI00375691B7